MSAPIRYISIAAGAAVCGAVLYASVFAYMGYRFVEIRLRELTKQSNVAGTSRYGIVISRDIASRTLEIALQRFPDDTKRVLVHVPEYASISRQDLIASGGAYTAMTPLRTAPFDEISAGTRVFFHLQPVDGAFESLRVVFGNPL